MISNVDAPSERTKVYVVSLRTATDRRTSFLHNASKDVPWQFFDAYTKIHPELLYNKDYVKRHHGRELTKGEIGCYSSHYAIWSELSKSAENGAAIVLEDDVLVDWVFLQKLIEACPSSDYIRLYQKRPTRFRVIQKEFIERTRSLLHLHGFSFGTQGYYITKEGAARMVAATKQVVAPVDDVMDRSWTHGVETHCIFPFPIIERSIPSEIGNKRFERSSTAPFDIQRVTNKARIKLAYYSSLARFILRLC